jgi:hypothetical protein
MREGQSEPPRFRSLILDFLYAVFWCDVSNLKIERRD